MSALKHGKEARRGFKIRKNIRCSAENTGGASRLKKKLKAIGTRTATNLLDLIFVPRCAACGIAVESAKISLCEECEHIYSLESKQLCSDCSMPYPYCRCYVHYGDKRIKILRVTGYKVREASVSKQTVLGLKDNKHRAATERIAAEMTRVLTKRMPDLVEYKRNSVIVYIPRSERARRAAGHDHAFLIAKSISEETGIPIVKAFVSRGKRAQKTLNKEERMVNAELNYDIIPDACNFLNKNVIIVDDIITTGASVGVCGEMLLRAGADSVTALVYAKTERF